MEPPGFPDVESPEMEKTMKIHVIALALVFAAVSPAAAFAANAEMQLAAVAGDDAAFAEDVALNEESAEHPLNDAWLGMPVETATGLDVGYVIDAPVNEYGEIVQLVIDTGNSDIYGLEAEITVSASRAELSDTHVEIPETVARLGGL
jgi:hypothetical protein